MASDAHTVTLADPLGQVLSSWAAEQGVPSDELLQELVERQLAWVGFLLGRDKGLAQRVARYAESSDRQAEWAAFARDEATEDDPLRARRVMDAEHDPFGVVDAFSR